MYYEMVWLGEMDRAVLQEILRILLGVLCDGMTLQDGSCLVAGDLGERGGRGTVLSGV